MSEKETRKIISSKQAGLAAALGGLAFAWRALGLNIPWVPPFVVDLGHTLVVLGSFAGGPYVTLIISILIGIPSWDTWIDMLGYFITGLGICFLAKTIWKYRRSKFSHVLIWFYSVTAAYLVAPAYWLFMFDNFLHMIPFRATLFYVWSPLGDALPYTLLRGIPLSLALVYAPNYMQPRWRWRGGEEVVEKFTEEKGKKWDKKDTLGLVLYLLEILAAVTLIIFHP